MSSWVFIDLMPLKNRCKFEVFYARHIINEKRLLITQDPTELARFDNLISVLSISLSSK